MVLSAIMDSLEGLSEEIAALYTEKNGKFELTGIVGVKTQADIDRLQTALTKERAEHKDTKEKLNVWAELDYDDVVAKLDKIPEMEAAAKGKLDEAQIEEIVQRRVDGTIASRTAPLERQVAALTKERDSAVSERDELRGEKQTRTISDAVREQLTKMKVIPEAFEDAINLAERVFEIRADDGAVVTRDQVGVTPGISPDLWLQEIQPSRPHWWPASEGGGAPGSGKGAGANANNPWSAKNWNITAQNKIVRELGPEKASQMARAAGSALGAVRPPAEKKVA